MRNRSWLSKSMAFGVVLCGALVAILICSDTTKKSAMRPCLVYENGNAQIVDVDMDSYIVRILRVDDLQVVDVDGDQKWDSISRGVVTTSPITLADWEERLALVEANVCTVEYLKTEGLYDTMAEGKTFPPRARDELPISFPIETSQMFAK